MAISAAIFTALSGLNASLESMPDLFLGRTDNINIRFAAAIALCSIADSDACFLDEACSDGNTFG